jgi:hypothetical protein
MKRAEFAFPFLEGSTATLRLHPSLSRRRILSTGFSLMAERVGFELGHFPAVLHKKEVAENPCKHWYLSTPPSFTCFSNFTPFNNFSTFWN